MMTIANHLTFTDYVTKWQMAQGAGGSRSIKRMGLRLGENIFAVQVVLAKKINGKTIIVITVN